MTHFATKPNATQGQQVDRCEEPSSQFFCWVCGDSAIDDRLICKSCHAEIENSLSETRETS